MDSKGGILKHPSIGKDNDRAWVSFLIELEKTSIYIKIGLNVGADHGEKGRRETVPPFVAQES